MATGLATIQAGLERASKFVRFESTVPARQSVLEFMKNPSFSTAPLGLIGGAGAGAYFSRRLGLPWWSGMFLGGSVGRNSASLFSGADRGSAIRNIAQTGAAVLGSKFTGDSLFGFAASWLLAGVAIHLFDGK